MKKRRLKKSNIEVIRDYWEKHEDILVEKSSEKSPNPAKIPPFPHALQKITY